MKVKHKIKKVFMMMICGLIALQTKVNSATNAIYNPSLYGIENPNKESITGEFLKYLETFLKISIIPIIFLIIGLIIYFKKSKKSVLNKIIIIYIIFSVIVLLFFIIWFFVSQN